MKGGSRIGAFESLFPFDGLLALAGLLLTAISVAIGVSFRAGMIWEGISEYKQRLRNLERQHRELIRRFHELRVQQARGELRDVDVETVGETGAPYVEDPEDLEIEEER